MISIPYTVEVDSLALIKSKRAQVRVTLWHAGKSIGRGNRVTRNNAGCQLFGPCEKYASIDDALRRSVMLASPCRGSRWGLQRPWEQPSSP